MSLWQLILTIIGSITIFFLLSIFLYRPIFKRVYDILLSGLALIILLPLLLFLAFLVRIKIGKPVVFRQKRPGKNGKIFHMHKFRTMTEDRDSEGKLLSDEYRVTKFGNILRSLSFDELLELWDIFIGKMSIVGPRPLREEYLSLYNIEQARRHNVRPGLTGLAQVSGRNLLTWEKRFELDVFYVDKYNIFTDIKIVIKTILKVFKRDGISEEGSATMSFFTGTKEINVLILSCGRRVELVKAFKVARDRLGVYGNVVCADCLVTAPALYFADKRYQVPLIASNNYLETIRQIVDKEKITIIVPTIDTELQVLADNKHEFEKLGVKILVPNSDIVKICGDKRISAKFLCENNFNIPYTLSEDEIKRYDGIYPLIIKPCNGSSSVDVFKINNRKELDFFSDYVKTPIIQQFVTGQEYTIDVLTDFEGNPLLIVPRKRLAVRGGEVLKGQIDKNQKIIDIVRNLLIKLNYVGFLTIQGFWTEDSQFIFIEMNARFGGGVPMSIKAGANFCEKLYQLLRGDTLSYDEGYSDGMVISRFDDSVIVKKNQAVIFDLDDTLYAEIEYLNSGCNAIAEYLSGGRKDLFEKYISSFNEIIKDSPFGVIDAFCEKYLDNHLDKDKILHIYRNHKPKIKLFSDVIACLKNLREKDLKLVLLTDGRPIGQRNKILALGLNEYFDEILVTDELGDIKYRKPNSYAYEYIANKLGVKIDECIVVGDNPSKDFAIKNKGCKVVRIKRGKELYGELPYFEGIMENCRIETLLEIDKCL